jgi:hypothetical protein
MMFGHNMSLKPAMLYVGIIVVESTHFCYYALNI